MMVTSAGADAPRVGYPIAPGTECQDIRGGGWLCATSECWRADGSGMCIAFNCPEDHTGSIKRSWRGKFDLSYMPRHMAGNSISKGKVRQCPKGWKSKYCVSSAQGMY